MGSRDSKAKWPECRTVARDIRQATHAARAFAEAQGIAADDQARFCIIIEELVANLYDHGGLAKGDTVELLLSRRTDGVGIVITDAGAPFDPRAAAGRLNIERGGGAGIRIVQKWTRVIDYRTQQGLNRLELIMPLQDGD